MEMIDLRSVDPAEVILMLVIGVLFLPLLVYMFAAHLLDYRVMKRYFMEKRRWDLNISCGNIDGGGVNADIVERKVRNFVLVKDIYNLPFRDNQFGNAICSHTIEHVECPDEFFRELKRVSRNVVLLVPPVWDVLAFLLFNEHKWQFLTLKSRHVNRLPGKVRLPYWRYQKEFGQKIRC